MKFTEVFPGLALRTERNRLALTQARMQNVALKQIESYYTYADTKEPDEELWLKDGREEKGIYNEYALERMYKAAQKLQYTAAGRNILQTLEDFIIGKRAKFTAEDEAPEVQEYWDEWVEINRWDMRSKQLVKRLYRDGEIFLRWFDPEIGHDHQLIRFVNPHEIKNTASTTDSDRFGIVTDPEDVEMVLEYRREWLKNKVVTNELIPAEEIIHYKIMVDDDVKRGLSFFTGIAKYMKEYEKWIEDRIMINRIRHLWNVVGEITGTPTEDFKNFFQDTIKKPATGDNPKKKVPRSGGVMLQKGVKWDLKNLNIKAQDTKDDGRLIQLMIAIGTNFPEYISRADASNSNMASTMVSESPFVRAMESHQDVVEKIFKEVFRRVIQFGIDKGKLKQKSKKTTITFDKKTGEDIEKKEDVETSIDCDINFAALLHRDNEKETKALVGQVTTKLVSKHTAREKLGYDNEVEEDQIAREEKADDESMRAREPLAPDDNNNNNNNDEE